MSYSALFTSGLTLASQPRPDYESYTTMSRPPALTVNIHPGTPRPRLRKRRSSLTIATSPISGVKSPTWAANESLRLAIRSPREGNFLESLAATAKPKSVRRKTISNVRDLPSYPAPTSPLPTLPSFPLSSFTSSAPISPTDDACPSSPITSESPFASHASWLRPNAHSRKSSTLMPPVTFPRSRSSSASGREPFLPSPLAGNAGHDHDHGRDTGMVVEKDASGAVWYDEDEAMKENET